MKIILLSICLTSTRCGAKHIESVEESTIIDKSTYTVYNYNYNTFKYYDKEIIKF